MAEPDAQHGWILQRFVKDKDVFAGRCQLSDVSVEWLQNIFSEPSPDDMMCLCYPVGPEQADALRPKLPGALELDRFDYFVCGWAERGFRTPGGFYPPPMDLSAAFGDVEPARPRSRGAPASRPWTQLG